MTAAMSSAEKPYFGEDFGGVLAEPARAHCLGFLAAPDLNAYLMGVDSFFVTVCEFATVHADGTFTIVRGGIDRWVGTTFPVSLSFWILVSVPPGVLPAGEIPFKVSVTIPDRESPEEVRGVFLVRDPDLGSVFAFPYQTEFHQYGSFVMEISVGSRIFKKTLEVAQSTGDAT